MYFYDIHYPMINKLAENISTNLINDVICLISERVSRFNPNLCALFDVHSDHVGLGVIFQELGSYLGDLFGLEPDLQITQEISTIFELLEDVLVSCGPEDQVAIASSFFEEVPILAITSYLSSIGPTTLDLLEHLD